MKCSLCDYLCYIEGTDEPFCSNNQRFGYKSVIDPGIDDPNKGRICKFYFPNYEFPREE